MSALIWDCPCCNWGTLVSWRPGMILFAEQQLEQEVELHEWIGHGIKWPAS